MRNQSFPGFPLPMGRHVQPNLGRCNDLEPPQEVGILAVSVWQQLAVGHGVHRMGGTGQQLRSSCVRPIPKSNLVVVCLIDLLWS